MDEAAVLRLEEFIEIQRREVALWEELRTKGDSVLLRERIARLQALSAALQGFPEYMAR